MNLKELVLLFILTAFSQVLLGQIDTPKTSEESLSVFYFEEQLPIFPGGQKAIYKIISDNMVYPKTAFDDRIGGKVITQFTIDTSGNVTNVKVVDGVRQDIDKEAIRLIGLLPNWTPGTQNRKKVKVVYNLPLYFYPNNKFMREYKKENNLKN